MRIISHKKLKEFYSPEEHPAARVSLERWHQIVSAAKWKNFSDIKADFPHADYIGDQRYIFNISGNHYRLVVVIKFTIGYVYIRFIGTHKEYDRIDVTKI